MSEDLSQAETSDEEEYEEELIDESPGPVAASPVPQTLAGAMKKKNLFSASKAKADKKAMASSPSKSQAHANGKSKAHSEKVPLPEFPKSESKKTFRLSGGKKGNVQELIAVGSGPKKQKATAASDVKMKMKKTQSKLSFTASSTATPKEATPKNNQKPKAKTKGKESGKEKKKPDPEPEQSFEATLQTMTKTKMENGTYRGKPAYIIHRGNFTDRFIIQVPKRGKRHPVLGEEAKPRTITDQIRDLSQAKALRFRDLTYVYIHVDNGKGSMGVFVAGLFTSLGTMSHVNATTIELPAYKELYAEEGGTSHRQAKIKDVITSENKQKATNFVLKIDKRPPDSGSEMVELQLPFLSTQAYHSIVNEDRRVTKQRQNRAEPAKPPSVPVPKAQPQPKPNPGPMTATNAVAAMAKATSQAIEAKTKAKSASAAKKRKRSEDAPEDLNGSGGDLGSPFTWPLSRKKRILFGKIVEKIHETKTTNFAISTGDSAQSVYTVKMDIESINFIN